MFGGKKRSLTVDETAPRKVSEEATMSSKEDNGKKSKKDKKEDKKKEKEKKDEKKEESKKEDAKKEDKDSRKDAPKKNPSMGTIRNSPSGNKITEKDVTFFAGQKKLSGHSCIISVRAPDLLTRGTVNKKKSGLEIYIPQEISADTFIDVLTFVYDGKLDFEKMHVVDVIKLLHATTFYESLPRLKWLCEDKIKKGLEMRYVHKVLKAVDELKLSIKENIIFYCLDNYNEFISNKNAAKELGIDLFQEVVGAYQSKTTGALKPPKEVPVPEPTDTYVSDMKSLYDAAKNTDINFKILEANMLGISGQMYKAHKAIVGGRAAGLIPMCNQPPVEVSKNVSAVGVKGVTPEAFEALLKWAYYNEQNVPTLAACELIPFCKRQNIPGLMNACINSIKRELDPETVLIVLDVTTEHDMPNFFLEAAKELRPKCIEYCIDHLAEINLEKIRTKKLSKKIAPDILLAIQKRAMDAK